MIRNFVGCRVSAHYNNEYFVCGDVVASRALGDNSVHVVNLVKPLNTGEVVLNTVVLNDPEIIEAWIPDCLEVV